VKISIITPSYNQGRFLEENIRSVMDQDHDDVEHIVMDGGSKDETVEVLRRFPHLVWTSERDGGQTNALNKGLSTNWVTLEGSQTTNVYTLPLNQLDPTVFFRMVHTNAP